jgi:hypothetical protein
MHVSRKMQTIKVYTSEMDIMEHHLALINECQHLKEFVSPQADTTKEINRRVPIRQQTGNRQHRRYTCAP